MEGFPPFRGGGHPAPATLRRRGLSCERPRLERLEPRNNQLFGDPPGLFSGAPGPKKQKQQKEDNRKNTEKTIIQKTEKQHRTNEKHKNKQNKNIKNKIKTYKNLSCGLASKYSPFFFFVQHAPPTPKGPPMGCDLIGSRALCELFAEPSLAV